MPRLAPVALLLAALAAPAPAEEVEVDVELFLAVDVSRSMSPRELEIQRRGYAEALASDEVVSAIENGPLGRIALTYVEWAGFGSQRVVVDWTLIDGREAAEAFATRISAHFDDALRRTSISSAIDYAAESFDDNGYFAARRVIDVSGDGPNNAGRPVAHARDDALAKGIVINGLPLMTKEGLGAEWTLDDLDLYYQACVIGGPLSFVVPVLSWDRFPTAVRLKLVQELAAAPPPDERPRPAQLRLELGPSYDCMIGEKIWERLRRDWGFP
ncbi:MAG: DUF1194 domain-containing protein [Pseudomonadota bacterium]